MPGLVSASLPNDTISEAGQDAFEPQIAVDEKGNALAVWTRSDGANLRVQAAFRPKGENFEPAETLSEAGQDAFEPQVAMSRKGDGIVVWTRFDGTNERIQAAFRSRWDGFEPVETISPAGTGASQPQVAIDHKGNALTVWTVSDGANLRVQSAFKPRWDSFEAPETLSDAGQDAFEPQVDFDHFNGSALAVWTRSDGTNLRVESAYRPAWDDFESPELVSEAGQDAFEPQVALDHKGSATVVWTRSDGSDLRVQSAFRSKWDGYVSLETLSAAGQDAFEPQVAVDTRGNATAVWTRFDGANERVESAFRPYWDPFGPAETISDPGFGASQPQVTVDDHGNATAVWTQNDGLNLRVRTAFRPKWEGFGPPQAVSDAGQDAFEPQVAADGNGEAVAVWTRFDGANTRIQVGFRPRGLSFGGAQTLSEQGFGASQPQVSTDDRGNAISVWTEFDGANLRVRAAFRREGKAFGPAETLSDAGQDAFEPQVALDSNGNATAVWTRSDGVTTRVQAAFRPKWDEFGPAETVSEAGQNAFEPQVAADGEGNALAVWTRSDGTSLRVQAAFRDAWSSFDAPETLSEAGQDAFEPQVAMNRDGDAIAVWTRFDGSNERIQSAFRPAGDGFEAVETISEAGKGSSEPQVAIDHKGHALAVWTVGDGTLRIESAFKPRWEDFGTPAPISGPDAFEPQVAMNEEGDAIAVWTRSDGANTRIEGAHRADWEDFQPAEVISEPGQDAFEPQVAIDVKGNALAVWTRFDGANLRIQSAYRPSWDGFSDPETISSAGQDAFEPQVKFDSNRNGIAVWTRFDGANERVQADIRPRGGSFGAAGDATP